MLLSRTCFVDDEKIENPNVILKPEDSAEFTQIIFALGDVKFLPKKISNFFQQLESLTSSNGNFEKVSKENFENLTKLKSLNLIIGNLKKIEKNSFDDLTDLTNLNLADNKIKFLNSKTFRNLENLATLDISGNQIEILHPKTFENLKNLAMIFMNRNNLITLDRKLFMEKPKLTEIHASGNNFKHIDEWTFDGLSLDFLDIFSEECRVGILKEKVDLIELKENLRDNCKGSDFEINKIHGRMIEILKENENYEEI